MVIIAEAHSSDPGGREILFISTITKEFIEVQDHIEAFSIPRGSMKSAVRRKFQIDPVRNTTTNHVEYFSRDQVEQQTDLQPVPSDESTDDPSEDHNIMEDLSVLLPYPNDPQFQPALEAPQVSSCNCKRNNVGNPRWTITENRPGIDLMEQRS
ncbi:hypothetical protein RRG08_013443 [Elysia crispata]|uniref:Uncharacterized protein n=1 Tax=Elysia crispata TaxID=231223 RepID=A0AAE0ZNZ1_9GAST|nr:hypothetical protein RRG08_013443 [Elysia crispata]